ncbi:hypothetical protein J6A31_07440 [bacterium]|nr:hypothetical protein [bacterium]
MSLKQSVVIVNEFTTKTANGGTRGGTPGDYVLRYMSRDGATEDLTPVRHDTENFIMRYMAREEAVDNAVSVANLKADMRSIQGDGGVAFGYGDVSLSHKKLKLAAKDIQKNFDDGKTVLKTVLSFDEEYLRKYGIISPTFHLEQEGDYRGNIDQMKLRMAIMNGIDKMSKNYDDLQYIGVIQVDTKHVHCHLAMVDRGVGTLMPDGTQRGKITDKEKQELRRGIDMFLDEKQTVKMMSANVEHDRRNTVCFVKKYTHQAMNNRGFSQFLLACLPEDRSLWRASSNNKEMQKANSIVREYVHELLKQPDSGYDEALKRVDEYARSRVKNEGLDGKEYRELYKAGYNRIINDSMNSVYSVLRQIPEDEMVVRTPMMETMALSYEDMANEADTDPMIEFGFKLRSYKSRLDYHKKELHKYHAAVYDYERRERLGEADETSKPLYEFFKFEEEYNTMLLSKYQHFLSFIPPEDEYKQGFDDLMSYNDRIDNMMRMRADATMSRMTANHAEEYGLKVYNEFDGQYMVTNPSIIDEKIERMKNHFDDMKDAYKEKLMDYGLVLTDDNAIVKKEQYPFDEVKALDLHHLMYDFPYDFAISTDNVDRFINMADKRKNKFEKAKQYLLKTNQQHLIHNLPEDDIDAQSVIADRFKEDTTLHTKREVTAEKRKATKTVRIDYDFYIQQEEDIKKLIKNTVNTLQYD